MNQIEYENLVYERLQKRRYLQPIFSGGCYDMNRRIREYDPALFVVWNRKRGKYEIHSLNHLGNSYAVDVPGNRLDARAEEALRKGDIRIRGSVIFREIDEHNENIEKSEHRQRRNELLGIAEELHPYFRKLAWEGV